MNEEQYCNAGPYTYNAERSQQTGLLVINCQACGAEIAQLRTQTGGGSATHRKPDRAAIYANKILPLIQQIDAIAVKFHIPFVMTFQTSVDGYNTSYFAPPDAASEIKDSANR